MAIQISAASPSGSLSIGHAIDPDVAAQLGINPLLQRGPSLRDFEQSFPQQQIDLEREKFKQADARRQQTLNLLGLTPETLGPGGLLGGTFFQSILGNTLPGVVGGVTGAIPGLGGGGGGGLSQPGFPDVPGGGGRGSLFDQQIAGRGEFGQAILNRLGGFGEGERMRIGREQQNLQNTALAHLEARGYGGTNLATGEIERAARFGGEQRAQLEDRLIGQEVNALQSIGEGIFGDVGSELDRGVERQRTAASLMNALLGSALSTVSF